MIGQHSRLDTSLEQFNLVLGRCEQFRLLLRRSVRSGPELPTEPVPDPEPARAEAPAVPAGVGSTTAGAPTADPRRPAHRRQPPPPRLLMPSPLATGGWTGPPP